MEMTQRLCDIRTTDLVRSVLAVNNFKTIPVAWNVPPPGCHCQVKSHTVALQKIGQKSGMVTVTARGPHPNEYKIHQLKSSSPFWSWFPLKHMKKVRSVVPDVSYVSYINTVYA